MNTTTNWTNEQGNAADEEYSTFLAKVNLRYMQAASGPVFLTDADDLWVRYMEQFPGHEQQVHNCNSCRHFIERYAGLVTIDPNTGKTKSALWVVEDAPELYKASVYAMKAAAEQAKVVAPFYSNLRVFGDPRTGKWTHLHAHNPAVHTDRVLDPHQKMAQKKQDYLMVLQALAEFPLEVAKKAVALLEAEALYRSERFQGPAKWFLNLHEQRNARSEGKARNNAIWYAVATAPEGYAHIRSSVIGTLLEDLKSGLGYDDIKRRFADKTNVATYQRAQAAPTTGAIQQAEKLFETLGLAPALPRRYARLDDLRLSDCYWVPRKQAASDLADRGAVFGHLKAKAKDAPAVLADLSVPPKAITWDKFAEKVLPTATKLEVVVPATTERFMAMTTAVNSDAPPILQWDNEGTDRNPFSWYYASGVDAEIKRRVQRAGGQYDNVDIRASLIWEGLNDLDIHCMGPDGHISFNDKRRGNGALDVDANANCAWNVTDTPVENIRWPKGQAREGTYIFRVNHYATHKLTPARTPFRVELEVDGQVFHFNGVTSRIGQTVELPALQYRRGEALQEVPGQLVRASGGNPSDWALVPNTLVPVTAVVPSPNLWGERPMVQSGQHVFFLLEGCKDLAAGRGRGFFTEQIKSELRPVRSVLEAHLAQAEVEGVPDATACGVGISSQGTGDLVVKVTSSTGAMLYKIDRWD